MPAPGVEPSKRLPWKYKAQAREFRESFGDPRYAMIFEQMLEDLMDSALPLPARGVGFFYRNCNFNLSSVAVDVMPKVDERDQVPRRLNQTDLAERLGCIPASASGLARLFRETGFLLPEEDGFYINPGMQASLFMKDRENPPVSPLDSSRTSGVQNGLQTFEQHRDGVFLPEHPEHLEQLAQIERELDRLSELAAQQRELRHALRVRELNAYKAYKRAAERAGRNGAPSNGTSRSANCTQAEPEIHSTPPPPAEAAEPITECEEKLRHSQAESGVNSSEINTPAKENHMDTVALSSSGGNATGKVTTTTDDPNPRTTPERERPDSIATPATETDAERAQVAEAILQQRIPADDLLVDTIIHACRANERTATMDEIRHFIDVKGPIALSKDHPGAYLRTAVSNCFAGASFAEFRKAAASLSRTRPRMPSPAEVEAQRNLTEAQEAEQQAWEAQRQRLKEHPEECMKCSGSGHYQLEERRKLCDCPAGDQRRRRGERDSP
jgi:hypothetical protein